jgi:hypothetical protein
VAVGLEVIVLVGSGVAVGIAVAVGVGTGVSVGLKVGATAVFVGVAVRVLVEVAVAVRVTEGVAVAVPVLVGVCFAVGDPVALGVAVGTVTPQGSTPTGKPVRRRLRLTSLTSSRSTSPSRSTSAQRHCGASAKFWPTQRPAIAKSTALTIPSLLRSGSSGSTTPDAMPSSLRISPCAERLAPAARSPPPIASAHRQTSSRPSHSLLGSRIPIQPFGPFLALGARSRAIPLNRGATGPWQSCSGSKTFAARIG